MNVRRSITKRLFINISAMIVVFTLVLLLANSLLLKPLYLKAIANKMTSALSTLTSVENGTISETWLSEVQNLNIGNDFDALVVLEDDVIYSASPEFGVRGIQSEASNQKHRETQDKSKLPLDEDSLLIKVTNDIEEVVRDDDDLNEKGPVIIYRRMMDEGLYVYLIQPMEPVNDSVLMANQLLMICATLFLVISVFIAMRMANQFTKPIKEIEKQVDAMNRFEFDQTLSITTGDELEFLGNEVNQLSKTLETSLNKLNDQNKQLEKDVKSQKRFISSASHELRTPLALIKGYSEEIEAGYVKDVKMQQKYMSYISEEASKMSRLLDEILELSRLESGRMELHEGPLWIKEAVVGFLDKYDGFIREQGLSVEVAIEDTLLGHFDPVRFEQILVNYISNAAKYGDEQKIIRIRAIKHEGRIKVTVFNTGSPIKEAVMVHLWDGFYMADEARSGNQNSYGLGLSIVKAIQNVGQNAYGAKNVKDGVEFWFDVKCN